jgi:glycosyltransferase involved in cell wall biosynthesis
MKAPNDPVPSGDRKIARLFLQALGDGGHELTLASGFRSWEGAGDSGRQRRLRDVGERIAKRLLRRYRALPSERRPETWFTYHVYHKAPDWIGPHVSAALAIPYVVAEASYAPKQAGGPWAIGHQAAAAAISRSAAILALNSNDIPCVLPLLDNPRRLVPLRPFLDTREYPARNASEPDLDALCRRFNVAPDRPRLLTVAMMRYGNKLACYQLLANALRSIAEPRVVALLVGDGPARADVQAAFADIPQHQIVFAGLQPQEMLKDFFAAADLFAWPAVDEPFGMALLEAQTAGLPVVAGRSRGVADVVHDGVSGVLVPPRDVDAFARALVSLLRSPDRLRAMGSAARATAVREHDIGTATITLNRVLEHVRTGAVP